MFRSPKTRSYNYVETPTLLPPKLNEFEHQAFTTSRHQSLARWLADPAWPRETLSIYGLEGYLTALLVWPIGLQPGAWLPPIWNEAGWRVRSPIDTAPTYREFIELVLAFLRHIDDGLLRTPAIFEPCLHPLGRTDLDLRGRTAHWAHGFGRGLRQAPQARGTPALEAREAVRTIATYATDQRRPWSGGHYRGGVEIAQAALTLARTRASRGPLGPLPKRTMPSEDLTAAKLPLPEGSGPLEDRG
jgi:yecA family protein